MGRESRYLKTPTSGMPDLAQSHHPDSCVSVGGWEGYGRPSHPFLFWVPTVALTDKQKRFVAEYLIDLNGTQAAIRSGCCCEECR